MRVGPGSFDYAQLFNILAQSEWIQLCIRLQRVGCRLGMGTATNSILSPLGAHYELPQDLPHKILTLMLALNDQGESAVPRTSPALAGSASSSYGSSRVYEYFGLVE